MQASSKRSDDHLRAERGVPREAMSVSGYWRRGRTEEGWRAEKPDWNREVERDDAELSACRRDRSLAVRAAGRAD